MTMPPVVETNPLMRAFAKKPKALPAPLFPVPIAQVLNLSEQAEEQKSVEDIFQFHSLPKEERERVVEPFITGGADDLDPAVVAGIGPDVRENIAFLDSLTQIFGKPKTLSFMEDPLPGVLGISIGEGVLTSRTPTRRVEVRRPSSLSSGVPGRDEVNPDTHRSTGRVGRLTKDTLIHEFAHRSSFTGEESEGEVTMPIDRWRKANGFSRARDVPVAEHFAESSVEAFRSLQEAHSGNVYRLAAFLAGVGIPERFAVSSGARLPIEPKAAALLARQMLKTKPFESLRGDKEIEKMLKQAEEYKSSKEPQE